MGLRLYYDKRKLKLYTNCDVLYIFAEGSHPSSKTPQICFNDAQTSAREIQILNTNNEQNMIWLFTTWSAYEDVQFFMGVIFRHLHQEYPLAQSQLFINVTFIAFFCVQTMQY